jgi:hypothetical protein
MLNDKINLYNDEIGKVEYVQHMGTDLTVVNAARVSFGKQKDELDAKDRRLIEYLISHRHTSTDSTHDLHGICDTCGGPLGEDFHTISTECLAGVVMCNECLGK